MTWRHWSVFFGTVVLLSATSAGQVPTAPLKVLRPISSINGKDLYTAYCAQCHGQNGKGDGPAAAGLRTPVPDLTLMATRSGGTFNRTGVARFISDDRPGRKLDYTTAQPVLMYNGVPDEMPAWGQIFMNMWPDAPVSVRAGNLARYIEKLQVR
jgi:hypothetical protein